MNEKQTSSSDVASAGIASTVEPSNNALVPPATDRALERWSFDHPVFGLLEVFVGHPVQLQAIDSGFSNSAVDADRKKLEKGRSSFVSPARRVPAIGRFLEDSDRSIVVKAAGVVIARKAMLGELKVGLKEHPTPVKDGHYDHEVAVGAPFLKIQTNAASSWVREVQVQARGQLIEFEAPPGSKAARRQQAMEESPFKRWFYPLMAGMGKGGWALFCLVLVPLLGRIVRPILEWLAQFLPDWDINIPWPDINLPRIPWPEFNLPSITWPEINLPSIPWPEWTPPDWVIFLMDYSKVWVPIVIGLVIGIRAVRNAQRSRETKLKWERERLATAIANHLRQLEESESHTEKTL